MLFDPANFLTHIKNIVTGGGRNAQGVPANDAGFLKRAEGVGLMSIAPTSDLTATATVFSVLDIGGTPDSTLVALTGSGSDPITAADAATINNNFEDTATKINALVADIAAIRAKLGMTTDETNARVIKVEENIDTIGNIVFTIPRDYDEATDVFVLRVLASQLTSSTDNDVQLDSELYRKRAGVALTADLAPAAPSTILSTTEQWIEFTYTGNSFKRDDVAIIELLTDGHNDTNGEEVLIHGIELVYRSTLVSYHEETTAHVSLR